MGHKEGWAQGETAKGHRRGWGGGLYDAIEFTRISQKSAFTPTSSPPVRGVSRIKTGLTTSGTHARSSRFPDHARKHSAEAAFEEGEITVRYLSPDVGSTWGRTPTIIGAAKLGIDLSDSQSPRLCGREGEIRASFCTAGRRSEGRPGAANCHNHRVASEPALKGGGRLSHHRRLGSSIGRG